ncbi:Tkl protein kinase, partial [Globisporangium polare]
MDNTTTQAPDELMARPEPRATLQQVLAEARNLTPFMVEAQDMCLHVL